MRLLAIWPIVSTSWAISSITTKERLPVPIPVSTTDWVMNGSIRLMTLVTSIARSIWPMNDL